VTCAAGASWEAPLVRGLQRRELAVDVVRRCVDHGELLAFAQREHPRAAVVAAEVPWLDRDFVGALHEAGVTVVAIEARPGARPLERIGVTYRIAAPPPVDELVGLLRGIETDAPAPVRSRNGDRTGRPGRLIVVWGGPGAPGRTAVAVHLALELRRASSSALLVDGDGWAPSIAQLLGLAAEPALTNAVHDAGNGWPRPLRASLVEGPGRLRVLAGLPRADLWPEVRERAWREVLDAARADATVVVDVAAPIEEDEELSFDRVPFRRNLMTRVALEEADQVVMVVRADPIGLRHGIFAFRALQEALPAAADRTSVVLNRTPPSARRTQECSNAVAEWTGRPPVALLPVEDALTRALWEGRALAHVAPRSRWLRELRAMEVAQQ
jgi:hypothetical protein